MVPHQEKSGNDAAGGQAAQSHVPVLLREIVDLLAPKPGDTVLDCTAGRCGHAAAFAERIGPTGTLILFDLDPANLAYAAERIAQLPHPPRVIAHHASFADAPRLLKPDSMAANIMLADLGFASNQVDDPRRGFSFSRDGPLDMRLNPQAPIPASELVNTLPERELAELIRDFGEEPWPEARRIAAKVVSERARTPIETTAQLASIVRSAIPVWRAAQSSIHPATKTFQALRIAVNDELGSLERLLGSIERAAVGIGGGSSGTGSGSWLSPGARVGIIAFHSLEDRPVKRCFSSLVERGLAAELTRKPVTASDEEIASNPRSRSAKFRAVRIGG